MISTLKFRLRDHLPEKVYRKIRYIRRMGVLNTLKFKLGLRTQEMEFAMERIGRGLKLSKILRKNIKKMIREIKSV